MDKCPLKKNTKLELRHVFELRCMKQRIDISVK